MLEKSKTIESVEKLGDNVFLINNLVKITLDETSVEEYCKLEFNEENISEDDANELVDEFFITVIKYHNELEKGE